MLMHDSGECLHHQNYHVQDNDDDEPINEDDNQLGNVHIGEIFHQVNEDDPNKNGLINNDEEMEIQPGGDPKKMIMIKRHPLEEEDFQACSNQYEMELTIPQGKERALHKSIFTENLINDHDLAYVTNIAKSEENLTLEEHDDHEILQLEH